MGIKLTKPGNKILNTVPVKSANLKVALFFYKDGED
jgi:hypothetical protein